MNRRLKAIPVAKLVKAHWNYKGDNDRTMEALVDNVSRNGQVINLIVRDMEGEPGMEEGSYYKKGYYEVVNGNHRLDALRKLGMEKAVCMDLGKVTIEEAKKVAIETNETNFRVDPGKLAQVVTHAVDGTKFNLEKHKLPFEVEEVNRFREMAEIDWQQKPKPPRKGSAADVKKSADEEKKKNKKAQDEKTKKGPLYECPHCGHQFDEEEKSE